MPTQIHSSAQGTPHHGRQARTFDTRASGPGPPQSRVVDGKGTFEPNIRRQE